MNLLRALLQPFRPAPPKPEPPMPLSMPIPQTFGERYRATPCTCPREQVRGHLPACPRYPLEQELINHGTVLARRFRP